MFKQNLSIILASQSPRRKQLLQQIGIEPLCHPVDIDETPGINEKPLDYCKRMAEQKSLAGVEKSTDNIPVLGSDTIVVLGNKILGKPKDKADAVRMLQSLSGKSHKVITCVCVTKEDRQLQKCSVSEVTFSTIPEKEIISYVDSNEPMDKAGSYAIQGYAAVWISQIKGSYTGIMGLPLYETAQILREFL